MTIKPMLTAIAACSVAGLDRNRFNEHVAAGHYPCAPSTTAGRARYFDPDDMVGLRLFRDLMDEGYDARNAGRIACAIAVCARLNPATAAISYVQTSVGSNSAVPAQDVPPIEEWETKLFSGSDIRKVTTYNIAKIRKMNERYTEEERAVVGERDE